MMQLSPFLLTTLTLPLVLADKSCTLYPTLNTANCRAAPTTDSNVVHVWNQGTIIGVSCKDTSGQCVNGNCVWDYVPGWGCWVSATITNTGCECMFISTGFWRLGETRYFCLLIGMQPVCQFVRL